MRKVKKIWNYYIYYLCAHYFSKTQNLRTPKLSVFGLEQLRDGWTTKKLLYEVFLKVDEWKQNMLESLMVVYRLVVGFKTTEEGGDPSKGRFFASYDPFLSEGSYN